VATITDDVKSYAERVFRTLRDNGLRVILDDSNEKINYKIREMSLRKIPYLIILGKNEESSNNISVRTFGDQKTLAITLERFIEIVKGKVNAKSRDFLLE
jgi:threonyl-tRNA synthetase